PEIDPDGKLAGQIALRSARRPEVMDLLTGRPDSIADGVRKETPQPWTTGEDVDVRIDVRAIFQSDRRQGTVSDASWFGIRDSIVATALFESIAHRNTGSSREQRSGLAFQIRRFHSVKIDLRIALRGVGDRQLVDGKAEVFEY